MTNFFASNQYDPSNTNNWTSQSGYASQPVEYTPNIYGPVRYSNINQTYDKMIPSFQQPFNERTNLYVSGFPTEWNSTHLRNLFSVFGTVSEIKVITKSSPDVNRGVAFIHFSKHSSAEAAIEGLRDKTPTNCTSPLTVRFANANRNVQPEFLRSMRVSITKMRQQGWALESALNLYVCQLPIDITEEKISNIFSPFGKITKIKVTRSEKGSVAFVHYESPEEAIKAVAQMDDFELKETPTSFLRVRFANINKSKIPSWFSIECLKNMQTTTNVYVSQIPLSWDETNLRELFSKYGEITEIKMLSRKEVTGGVAFIHYQKPISACRAIACLNEKSPSKDLENPILVTFARMDAITFDRLMNNRFCFGTQVNPSLAYNNQISAVYPYSNKPPTSYQRNLTPTVNKNKIHEQNTDSQNIMQ